MGGSNAILWENVKATKENFTSSYEAILKAHTSFTSNYNSFLALSEQFEDKFKELELREAAVQQCEKELTNKIKQLDEREKICTERELKVEKRDQEVSAKEKTWDETEKRMQQNAAKLPNVLKFNVSGTTFALTKEKLLRHKGSLFEEMIVSDHSQRLDSGEIFIERDPKYFQYLMSFFLNGVSTFPKSDSKYTAVVQEFHHFKIPFVFLPRGDVKNTLIGVSMFEENIREWLPKKRFQLLYKASVDGFSAENFHKLCDNQGPTLTVIKSINQYLFGGFTPLPWESNKYKSHNDMFIFTLTNPHNILPTKYPLKPKDQYGTVSWTGYGPVFGGGTDIRVFSNSNQNKSSYTNFPNSYVDTTGKGDSTFTGERQFAVSDIEVFLVL